MKNLLNETSANSWDKVYWYSRMLINNDKYGAIGKNKKLLLLLVKSLSEILSLEIDSTEIMFSCKSKLEKLLLAGMEKSTSKRQRVEKFINNVHVTFQNKKDVEAFVLTCELIILPINLTIENIPSDDKIFASDYIKKYLDKHGEKGIANVLYIWDDLGERGCLSLERSEIINAFGELREKLSVYPNMDDYSKNSILTTFVQEFERRAAQKRKGRAGGSLEDVTSFILDYYKISSTHQPEHFQADIEVDKWLKTKDNWLIGISCKRTLRERWKQVSSADSGMLSKFKIKYIFHLITYDEDLSDDKLALLGSQRHIFYLPDDSRRFLLAQENIGLKDYVRPISGIVQDLKSLMK